MSALPRLGWAAGAGDGLRRGRAGRNFLFDPVWTFGPEPKLEVYCSDWGPFRFSFLVELKTDVIIALLAKSLRDAGKVFEQSRSHAAVI